MLLSANLFGKYAGNGCFDRLCAMTYYSALQRADTEKRTDDLATWAAIVRPSQSVDRASRMKGTMLIPKEQ
jgi:hypothetical protein